MASKRDKKKRCKVRLQGHGSFICDPPDLEENIKCMNEDGEYKFIVEDVWMTDEEYEALPEFQGF